MTAAMTAHARSGEPMDDKVTPGLGWVAARLSSTWYSDCTVANCGAK
jgi:hypothetical protein